MRRPCEGIPDSGCKLIGTHQNGGGFYCPFWHPFKTREEREKEGHDDYCPYAQTEEERQDNKVTEVIA